MSIMPQKSQSIKKPDIERLLAALRRQKLDRTPNFEIWIGPRSISHILHKQDYALDFWTMPPKDAVELVNAIGQDAIVCSLQPPLPPEGSILTPDDLAAFFMENADIDFQSFRTKLQTCLDAVAGTGIGVVVRIGGPLTQTYMACGPVPIESFMLMLYDQPDLIDNCMKIFTRWSLQIIDAVNDMPFHLYYIGDDLCDNKGAMISPDAIAQHWAPYYEQIINAAHATAHPVICHCCGAQAPVIPYWLKWNVEACHPLQSGANDIYAFKQNYGDRIVPVGNISVGLLSSGTPDEIRDDTRRHLKALAGDGGYVACSDHSIIDSVIPENFMAMVNAVHEFGQY
ncbi:MAG: uroporphyrinogen decarboxylase family protein [Lentisphaerota bacterium]